MTNTPDLLEKIRAKIAESVPSVKTLHDDPCVGWCGLSNSCEMFHWRTITIADVLLAIDKTYNPRLDRDIAITPEGDFLEQKWERVPVREESYGYYGRKWDLTKDLDGQNEETLTFISSILGVC